MKMKCFGCGRPHLINLDYVLECDQCGINNMQIIREILKGKHKEGKILYFIVVCIIMLLIYKGNKQ